MPDDPPSKKRPDCAAATPVEPKKNESGSTTVLCWLVELVNGSVAILRTGIDALAARLSTSAAVAANPSARAARLPCIAPPWVPFRVVYTSAAAVKRRTNVTAKRFEKARGRLAPASRRPFGKDLLVRQVERRPPVRACSAEDDRVVCDIRAGSRRQSGRGRL